MSHNEVSNSDQLEPFTMCGTMTYTWLAPHNKTLFTLSSYPCSLPGLGNRQFASISVDLSVLRILYKWNNLLCDFFLF